MSYRLLALDLDDTLLNAQGRISPRNREAIRAAQGRGVVVTLATGRMYRSARVFAEELGVVVPLITYNGALIKDNNGRVYWDRPLPLAAAQTALAVARRHDVHVNLFLDDTLYVDRDDVWTEQYRRSSGVTPHLVPDLAE
ncbi:MAG TPA: HAD-IIB family hydrolase, partial [Firmicutes bacterium]|nr:HAD-IIB family hydrolase [Bacillota bacterium]